jgi:hypothetical protein
MIALRVFVGVSLKTHATELDVRAGAAFWDIIKGDTL